MVDEAMAPNLGGGMTPRGHLERLERSDCQEWSGRCCWWLKGTDQRHLNTLEHTGRTFSKRHPASRVNCAKDEKHWPGTPEGLSGALGRSIILMSKVKSPRLLVK